MAGQSSQSRTHTRVVIVLGTDNRPLCVHSVVPTAPVHHGRKAVTYVSTRIDTVPEWLRGGTLNAMVSAAQVRRHHCCPHPASLSEVGVGRRGGPAGWAASGPRRCAQAGRKEAVRRVQERIPPACRRFVPRMLTSTGKVGGQRRGGSAFVGAAPHASRPCPPARCPVQVRLMQMMELRELKIVSCFEAACGEVGVAILRAMHLLSRPPSPPVPGQPPPPGAASRAGRARLPSAAVRGNAMTVARPGQGAEAAAPAAAPVGAAAATGAAADAAPPVPAPNRQPVLARQPLSPAVPGLGKAVPAASGRRAGLPRPRLGAFQVVGTGGGRAGGRRSGGLMAALQLQGCPPPPPGAPCSVGVLCGRVF